MYILHCADADHLVLQAAVAELSQFIKVHVPEPVLTES